MSDVIDALKAHARILHRKLKDHDPKAEAALRRLPDLHKLAGKDLVEAVQRRHCLSAIARRHGFNGWSHAVEVLTREEPTGFGRLLCPGRCEILTNVWCRSHDEALAAQEQYGGIILPYMHQFLIATTSYLRELGLDPDDPDLEALGSDWSAPQDRKARQSLCGKVVAANMAWDEARR